MQGRKRPYQDYLGNFATPHLCAENVIALQNNLIVWSIFRGDESVQ